MIRRIAIASLLTLASAAGLSSAAFAQTATDTVIASNTHAKACVISNGTPSIAPNPASGFITSFAVSASASVQCNSVGSALYALAENHSPAIDLPDSFAPGAPTSIPGSGAPTPVTNTFIAQKPAAATVMPAGTYNFAMTLNVTY